MRPAEPGRALVSLFVHVMFAATEGCSPEVRLLESVPEPPTACTAHAECPSGELCIFEKDGVGRVCRACGAASSADTCSLTCPAPWTLAETKTNGCRACTCAPPSECTSDSECPRGHRCYPGQACEPSCNGSPRCCAGSFCALPGCTDTSDVECGLVGCNEGQVCSQVCPLSCECDATNGRWSCAGGCGAVCRAP